MLIRDHPAGFVRPEPPEPPSQEPETMTTIAERIAQVSARARQAGRTTSAPPRPVIVRQIERETHPTERKESQPAALTRPLPEVHGRAEEITRVRVAAYWIARALGDGWRKHVDEEWNDRGTYLIHRSGLRIEIRKHWQHKGRLMITLRDVNRIDGLCREITVSATRSPLAIAGEIERRILQTGAAAALRNTDECRQKRRRDEVAERLTVLRLARAAGETHVAQRSQARHGHPETNRVATGNGFVWGCQNYNGRICLELELLDVELAEQIIDLVRTYRKDPL